MNRDRSKSFRRFPLRRRMVSHIQGPHRRDIEEAAHPAHHQQTRRGPSVPAVARQRPPRLKGEAHKAVARALFNPAAATAARAAFVNRQQRTADYAG
jgi:hypothetical protein